MGWWKEEREGEKEGRVGNSVLKASLCEAEKEREREGVNQRGRERWEKRERRKREKRKRGEGKGREDLSLCHIIFELPFYFSALLHHSTLITIYISL